MATPARTTTRRPSSTVIPSTSNTSPPRSKAASATTAISKGATARSAVSPRAIPPANGRTRTPNASISTSRASPVPTGESDELAATLKRETAEKEEVLLRLQEKESQMEEFRQETSTLTSALHAAEARLSELYTEQSRAEEEMARRIEISDKLRTQVRELEKEKREALRRYAEQTASFEAERQALYDNEQHLKSRIQSLSTAKKMYQDAPERAASPNPSMAPSMDQAESSSDILQDSTSDGNLRTPTTSSPRSPGKEHEPETSDGPEVTALKLELSTLSTSHTSIQAMVQALQTELGDLKRVNNELQEENESYGLLLMERALNGTGIEMLRQMGGQDQNSSRAESINDDSSMRSGRRSVLDRVAEDEEYTFESSQREATNSLASELSSGQEAPPSPLPSSRRRRVRHNSTSPRASTPVGESLADLPITGPGLDLAAELGRAESKDIIDDDINQDSPSKSRALKVSDSLEDKVVEALRQEVKSLKDANKALSLYASKIIDRIIMQDGFEQVLSVDYDPAKAPPTPRSPGAFEEVLARARESPAKNSPQKSTRPTSLFVGRSSSTKTTPSKENSFKFPLVGEPEKLKPFNTPTTTPGEVKKNRRSLSFDWKSFSVFGNSSPAVPEKGRNLRPLTLRPGAASTLAGARKLESHEDDEDRKERERLNATMKLMGIEKPANPPTLETLKPQAEATAQIEQKLPASNRFSWFKRAAPPAVPVELPASDNVPASLTSEALEQAEAESSLAALDAREKMLTAELAKGSGSGFTELNSGGLTLGEQWRSRRSRSAGGKSHDSSGASTVWSAGKGEEE